MGKLPYRKGQMALEMAPTMLRRSPRVVTGWHRWQFLRLEQHLLMLHLPRTFEMLQAAAAPETTHHLQQTTVLPQVEQQVQ